MSLANDFERLTNPKIRTWFERDIRLSDPVTVYLSHVNQSYNRRIFCALIPSDRVEESLSTTSWDLKSYDCLPGAVTHSINGEVETRYYRFGGHEGIEPLVMVRDFHDVREGYVELAEEFRHFHNLYHDKKADRYLKFDDAGSEQEVAIVEKDHVRVRLKEILQFTAIKEMHLAILVDWREHSYHSVADLKAEDESVQHTSSLAKWELSFGEFSGMIDLSSYSRLLGKRLFPPLPKSKSGLWGFQEEKDEKLVEFIIDVDEFGDNVYNKSSTEGDENQKATDYLTAVHFRKDVLDRYFQNPSKYDVSDSHLRCGSQWSLYIDNHHSNRVCAWLGDLLRDLPHAEQLHWRAHNVQPSGGVSETFFRRQILAEFTDSTRPDHVFRESYFELRDVCTNHLGWQLLKPLRPLDLHHFSGIRIPSSDEQKVFDELILGLTKTLVDSLNEKMLNRFLPNNVRSEVKGSISRLEAVFDRVGIADYDEHISFLRNLQALRSAGVAHRKSSNYQRIATDFGIEDNPMRDVFTEILVRANTTIRFFKTVVESGGFKRS